MTTVEQALHTLKELRTASFEARDAVRDGRLNAVHLPIIRMTNMLEDFSTLVVRMRDNAGE